MKQQTFSDLEYSNRRRKTKREKFLDAINEMIPWDYWVNFIHPYYMSGKHGGIRKISVLLKQVAEIEQGCSVRHLLCKEVKIHETAHSIAVV